MSDIPAGARQPPPQKNKAVKVRCLGPKKKEHTFWSPDPYRLRVCPRCTRQQRDNHLAARHLDPPLRVPQGPDD